MCGAQHSVANSMSGAQRTAACTGSAARLATNRPATSSIVGACKRSRGRCCDCHFDCELWLQGVGSGKRSWGRPRSCSDASCVRLPVDNELLDIFGRICCQPGDASRHMPDMVRRAWCGGVTLSKAKWFVTQRRGPVPRLELTSNGKL